MIQQMPRSRPAPGVPAGQKFLWRPALAAAATVARIPDRQEAGVGMPSAVFCDDHRVPPLSVLASPAKSLAAPCAASPGRYAADIPAAWRGRARGRLCCATGRRPRARRGSGRTASPDRLSLFATGALSVISPSGRDGAQWDNFPTSSPMTASVSLGGAYLCYLHRQADRNPSRDTLYYPPGACARQFLSVVRSASALGGNNTPPLRVGRRPSGGARSAAPRGLPVS